MPAFFTLAGDLVCGWRNLAGGASDLPTQKCAVQSPCMSILPWLLTMRMGIVAVTVVIVLGGSAFAAVPGTESPSQALRCDGRSTSRGIDAPSDALLPGPEDTGQTVVIETGQIRISTLGSQDQLMPMCMETSAKRVFSDACDVTAEAFVRTWRQIAAYPTMKSSIRVALNRIEIDRVTLQMQWLTLRSVIRSEVTKVPTSRAYFVEDTFSGRCKLVRSQL